MTKPQLLVLREGVFMPAKVLERDEGLYDGIDICVGNFVDILEEETSLDPRGLLQVSTRYLGGMKFIREELAGSPFTNICQNTGHMYTTNCGSGLEMIKRLAQMGEHATTRAGTPYFTIETSVTPVESVPTPIGRFTVDKFKDDISKLMFSDSMDKKLYVKNDEILSPLTKEVEYILHPTLNLYVPRE